MGYDLLSAGRLPEYEPFYVGRRRPTGRWSKSSAPFLQSLKPVSRSAAGRHWILAAGKQSWRGWGVWAGLSGERGDVSGGESEVDGVLADEAAEHQWKSKAVPSAASAVMRWIRLSCSGA